MTTSLPGLRFEEIPRFPLKGSFKGDIDIGIDIDM